MAAKRLNYNVVVSGKSRYPREEIPLWRSARVQGYMFTALCVVLFLIAAGIFIGTGKTKDTVVRSLNVVEQAETLKWENMRLGPYDFDTILKDRLNISSADADIAADTILKRSNDEYTVGTAYMYRGDWVDARIHLSNSISKRLSVDRSMMQTAKTYYYEGDKRHAKELIDRIGDGFFEKDPVAVEVKADIYAANGFYRQSANLYEQAIQLSSMENDTDRMKRNFKGYCAGMAQMGELTNDLCVLKDLPNGQNLAGKYGKESGPVI